MHACVYTGAYVYVYVHVYYEVYTVCIVLNLLLKYFSMA